MANELSAVPEGNTIVLTAAEQSFVKRLFDPMWCDAIPMLEQWGAAAGLRRVDVKYIREWVINKGVHWISGELAGLGTEESVLVFRNPVVRKIINYAASQGLCNGTSALKEEIEDHFTQQMRCSYIPAKDRDNAADKLAKLKGYYPETKNGNSGNANIQINFVNPYADEAKDSVNIGSKNG